MEQGRAEALAERLSAWGVQCEGMDMTGEDPDDGWWVGINDPELLEVVLEVLACQKETLPTTSAP